MNIRDSTLLLGIFLCLVKDANALRGSAIPAHDHATSRRLNKAHVEPYEQVATHKGGLFGAVKKVAIKAQEKKEAKGGGGEEETLISELATELATEPPTDIAQDSSGSVLPRDIPIFSLQFVVTSDENPADNLGNYNELQVVTEEYLGKRFDEVLTDTPALHKYTTVSVQKTSNPFIVDVTATTNFDIPGEVPTYDYLSGQVKRAFELLADAADQYETDYNSYLNELSQMSDTNPFQSTVDIVFSQWDPNDANEQSQGPNSQSNSSTLASIAPLLGALAFVVLVIAALLWLKVRQSDNQALANDPRRLAGAKDNDDEDDRDTQCSTSSFGADEESLRYLDEVRKEYSRASNLQEVSLVDEAKRIGELKHKPEPVGTYENPNVVEDEEEEFDEEYVEEEPSNLSKFEQLLGKALGNDDEEEEDEFEEEEYVEEFLEDTDIQIDETLEWTSAQQVPEEQIDNSYDTAPDPPAPDPPTEGTAVGKKDLFSFWEKRTTGADVDDGNKNTPASIL